MLDLFTIFSKGGLVLWYFQGTTQLFTNSVNELIKSVILQERGVTSAWNHNTLSLQYKLDNEFELVFVVAYQNILKLTYIDKFLSEIQLRFRDKYKRQIENKQFGFDFSDFQEDFNELLKECETEAKLAVRDSQKPKAYNESAKSSKTMSSMMEKKTGFLSNFMSNEPSASKTVAEQKKSSNPVPDDYDDEIMAQMIAENKKKLLAAKRPKKFEKAKSNPTSPKPKGKVGTKWDDQGHQGPLDYGSKEEPLSDSSPKNNDLDKYASVIINFVLFLRVFLNIFFLFDLKEK